MKKLLQITGLCLFAFAANAQNWDGTTTVWSYDLTAERHASYTSSYKITHGDGVDGYKTEANASVGNSPTASSAALGWWPQPASAGATATVQVRTTTTTGAVGYALIKEGADIKSIKIDAANNTNKFIIRDIDDSKASAVAKYSFTLKTNYRDGSGNKVTPGYARSYELVFGNDDGLTTTTSSSLFRDGNKPSAVNLYTNEAMFTSFQLSYVANSDNMTFAQRYVTKKYITSPAADGTSNLTTNVVSGTTVKADGSTLNIELYANNSAISQSYKVGATPYSVASQTCHLWVNGTKIGEYAIAAASQAPISIAKTLNSFMVYTIGTSTSEKTELGYGSVEVSDFQVDYLDTTLPVTLAGFTGSYHNNAVQLNWKTLSEKDNSHFEVLRSADGITFNEIAKVQGEGSTATTVNYTATDRSPLNGVNYYQLKQVDNNGDYTLSNVIAVNVALSSGVLQTVKKDGALGVNYYSQNNSAIQISITDLNGRQLYNSKTVVNSGANSFDIPTALYVPGVYVLSVKNDRGEVQRVKFLN